MNLRLPRGRATATIADQALSSASNFVVGLVVARLAGPAAFGTFALAYTVWLLAGGAHRALIVQPMMIVDPESRHGARRLQEALAAELLLGLAAAALVALGGGLLWAAGARALGWALLALAPWLPVFLVQDLWRWVGFMRGQPARSLANDVAFTATQAGLLAAFALAGRLGLGSVLAAWGGGAAVGAVLGLRQFGVPLRLAGGRRFLARAWPDGRWLLADFMTAYAASQGWQYLVAAVLGPAALGLVRAAHNLMGPTHVFLLGGSGYGLPTSVDALQREGWQRLRAVVRRVAAFITLATAAYVVPVVLARDPVVAFVYGDRYREIGLLVVLAGLSVLCTGAGYAAGIGLTTARRTRALFLVRLSQAVVSMCCFLLLVAPLGVAGAGWASLAGGLTYAVLIWTAWGWARRPEERDRPPEVVGLIRSSISSTTNTSGG